MPEENNQNQNFNPGAYPNQNPPSPYPTQNQDPYSTANFQQPAAVQNQNQPQPTNPFAPMNQNTPQQNGGFQQPAQPADSQNFESYSPFNQAQPENNPFATKEEESMSASQQNPFSSTTAQTQPMSQNPNSYQPMANSGQQPQPTTTQQNPFEHLNQLHDHPNQPMQSQSTGQSQPNLDNQNTFQPTTNKPDFQPLEKEESAKSKGGSKLGMVLGIVLIVIFAGVAGGAGFYAFTLYGENQDLQSRLEEAENNNDPVRLQNTIESIENDLNQAQEDLESAEDEIAQKELRIQELEDMVGGEVPEEVSLEQAQQIALDVMDGGTVTDSNATTEFGAAWKIEVTRSDETVSSVYVSTSGTVLKVLLAEAAEAPVTE